MVFDVTEKYPYDLILFDLDGTLIETAPEIADAVNDTLKQFDLPPVTRHLPYALAYGAAALNEGICRLLPGRPEPSRFRLGVAVMADIATLEEGLAAAAMGAGYAVLGAEASLAIAAVAILGTASASFAAQYAWVDQDANVKFKPHKGAMNVNWVEEGQKVKIIGQWNNWYKIQIPGPDGWVKKSALDFSPWGNGNWGNGNWGNGNWGNGGGQFCINGQHASFCISN